MCQDEHIEEYMKNSKSEQPENRSAVNDVTEGTNTEIAQTLSDFTPSAAFAAALNAVKNMGARAKSR